MNIRLAILGIVLAAGGFVLANSFFIVNEREQALILQFGDVRGVEQEPGLKFKLPFVQNVIYYDNRILNLDPNPQEITFADQRRLVVDAFIRYRISDPLDFYRSVRTETTAAARLESALNSSVRSILGNVIPVEILSDERVPIMNQISEQVIRQVDPLGITIVDVRIGRADVPGDTIQAVYDRMRSERERQAAESRAQGEELAQQIRSRADRERTVLLAEAERESEILRGEGDSEQIRITGEAFGQDENFYAFFRSLQAYREALADEETTLVLQPNSEFFRFFGAFEGVGGDALPVLPEPTTVPGDEAGDAGNGDGADTDGEPLTN